MAHNPGGTNQHRVPMKVAEYLANLGLPVVTNIIPGLKPLKPYVQATEIDAASFCARARWPWPCALAPEPVPNAGQAYVWRRLAWDRVAEDFL